MRELFEICPKIQFLKLFWCFLRFEGVNFVRKRVKLGVLTCQDEMETFPLKRSENDVYSTFSFIFPPVPPKNLVLPPTSKLPFEKYENRAIITKVSF